MEKNIQREALCSVLRTKYHSGDQMKKNETGGAYGTYWEQKGEYKVFGENTAWKEITWKT